MTACSTLITCARCEYLVIGTANVGGKRNWYSCLEWGRGQARKGRVGEKKKTVNDCLSCKKVEQLISELAWRWLHHTGLGVASWSPLLELKVQGNLRRIKGI